MGYMDGIYGWDGWMGCIDGVYRWDGWMGCIDGVCTNSVRTNSVRINGACIDEGWGWMEVLSRQAGPSEGHHHKEYF